MRERSILEKTVVLKNPHQNEEENQEQKKQNTLRDLYFAMAGRMFKFGKASEIEILIACILLDIAAVISRNMLTFKQRGIVDS